jgi:transcription antitermination factor NusG
MFKWFVIQSSLPSKESILAELKRGGYNPKSGNIKDILIFGFTQDNLDIDNKDNSLLEGYVLLKINDSALKDIIRLITSKHIGEFFNLGPNGIPYPVPNEQVNTFIKNVAVKKSKVSIGQKVRVTDGILSGFVGVVTGKRGLMAQISVKLPNREVKRWVAMPNLSSDIKE